MSDDTKISKLQRLKATNSIGRIVPYLLFLGLPTLAIVLGVFGVKYGYVSPSLTTDVSLSFTANLGWVLELLAAVTATLYAIFGVAMLVRITGVGFINSIIDVVTDLMDGYSK